MARPTLIKIHLDALKHNLRLIQSHAGNAKVISVVKANAYGHGAVAVGKAINNLTDMFAVASLEEALALKKAGITAPIMLLEGVFSPDELSLVIEHQFQLVVHNCQQVDWILSINNKRTLTLWLKVDTGMHRLGFSETEVFKQYKKLKQYSKQNVVKLMTHLASADVLSSQLTEQQVAKFTAIHQQLEQGNLEASVLNSAGLIVQKQSRFDWVRVGLLLYGVSPFSHKMDIEKQFKPVMEFVSEVIAIRTVNPGDSVGYGETWQAKNTTRIATVAAGYGDGYPRNAKSGTPVLVNGRKAHLAGRVSMDMLTADITDIPDVNIGDPVELWGQNLSVNHIASCVQTIGYELLTRMPTRASVQVLEDD